MLQRLKRLWKLSRKDKQVLDDLMALKEAEVDSIPDASENAVFFGQGTAEEYKEFQDEQKGLKGIFGIGK